MDNNISIKLQYAESIEKIGLARTYLSIISDSKREANKFVKAYLDDFHSDFISELYSLDYLDDFFKSYEKYAKDEKYKERLIMFKTIHKMNIVNEKHIKFYLNKLIKAENMIEELSYKYNNICEILNLK